MTHPTRKLSGTAFATLLLIALMMGANHVAARLAFNHGVDVATAVTFRSAITALVLAGLLLAQRVPLTFTARHRRALPAIGLLIGVQSLCLYSAVARLPVALALLAFNTYPLWTALWARLLYGHRPERAVLVAMPVMLVGLALALDVFGAASGLGAAGQWGRIGAGVASARGQRPGRPCAHLLHHGHRGCAGAGGRGLPGRLSLPHRRAGLVGAGGADLPLRHRLHHHVHRAAQAGRGGQLGHHERRTRLRPGAGLGHPGPGDRAGAGGGRAGGGGHGGVAGHAEEVRGWGHLELKGPDLD